MRRLRSSLALALVVSLASATTARPQSSTAGEGALELRLPIGARSLALGEAVVAYASGSDAVWYNPALLARAVREGALHVARTFATEAGGDYTASVVLPVQFVGTFAATARYLNFGDQASTDPTANTGIFAPISYILIGSFAAPFGDKFSAGLNYKLLITGFSCTGDCSTPDHVPPTNAFDVGAQYRWGKNWPFAVGVAIRNLGVPSQIHDSPQADPLPKRLDVGLVASPQLSQLPPEAKVRFSADIVTRLTDSDRGYRGGVEVSWQDKYQVRGGYVLHGEGGSNGSLGVGITLEKLQVDITQLVGGAATAGGVTPLYFSARYFF